MSIPCWNGVPITPGWWWLRFQDGPGPRYWDGTFWDRGSIFVAAEDYADNPILGPCLPPETDTTINYDVIRRAYGWTIDINGELCGLVAGDMGYEETGIVVPKEHLIACVAAWRETDDS